MTEFAPISFRRWCTAYDLLDLHVGILRNGWCFVLVSLVCADLVCSECSPGELLFVHSFGFWALLRLILPSLGLSSLGASVVHSVRRLSFRFACVPHVLFSAFRLLAVSACCLSVLFSSALVEMLRNYLGP